jgi:hypothetical protein
MAKRVNIDGPGDDPEEYWFECIDCGGEGSLLMNFGTEGEEWGECPGCDGMGCTSGDAGDL